MSNDPNRRRILGAIETHGALSRAEIQAALRMPFGPTTTRLAALERFGHVEYDPTTDTYRLTERTAEVRRTKKNSPARSGEINHSGDLVGPATGRGSITSMEHERERIIRDMEGDAGLVLHIVRDEPSLFERAALALDSGWAPPPLLDAPRFKRLAMLDEALTAHEALTSGGPCACCGTRKAIPGYEPRGYDPAKEGEPPTFHVKQTLLEGRPVCAWCMEFVATHSLNELRERVGCAVTSTVASVPAVGRYRFASKEYVPFAYEVAPQGSAKPWGHITPPMGDALRMLADRLVHPTRRIRTEAQAAAASVPGITAQIAPAPPRPAYVAPVVLGGTNAEFRRAEKALAKKHEEQRTAFLAANPRDHRGDGEPVVWSAQVKWMTLLLTQDEERKMLFARQPARTDGRPRQKAPHINPLPLAR